MSRCRRANEATTALDDNQRSREAWALTAAMREKRNLHRTRAGLSVSPDWKTVWVSKSSKHMKT
jgi:hypothetical protein